MSYLSSKQMHDINSLYESIYSEVLSEEKQNQLFMMEWYNAMVVEGLIDGNIADEESILDENLWVRAGQAIQKYGPKAMELARKVTGFGLGQGAGGKRRIVTTGAGTVAATDPEKAARQVGGVVTGTTTALSRAGQAAMGQAVPAANDKKKAEQESSLGLTPQGTIRVR